jgi:non-ribosomal peptide synthetase component F
VTDGAGDLSYRALAGRIENLAGVMAGQGIGRGARVGVCLPRTRDLPVAMLATLRTAAAYIPLDPSYPTQRLAAIIADAGPTVVIADPRTAKNLPRDTPLLFIEPSDVAPEAVTLASAPDDDLAYIIHTSAPRADRSALKSSAGRSRISWARCGPSCGCPLTMLCSP